MTIEIRGTKREKPPSPSMLAAMVVLFGPLGTGMVMQGLGSPVMDWLHPNPAIPRFVFLMLGLFMLACTLLIVSQLVHLPSAVVNGAGGLTIAIIFGVFNWMVFDGGGQTSCFIGPFPSFLFGHYGTALCTFVIKAGVVAIDAVAGLCLLAVLYRRVGRRAGG